MQTDLAADIQAASLDQIDAVTAEGTAGHTQRDYDEMVAAGIDPADRQPRDHPTVCGCGRQTWHLSATCDAHYEAPAVRR